MYAHIYIYAYIDMLILILIYIFQTNDTDFNRSAVNVNRKDHGKIQSKYNEEKYDDHKENEYPNKENNIEKIFSKSSYHRNMVSDNNLKKRLSTSSSVYEDDFEDYEGVF
jgi:hypothetical protein